MTLVLDKQAQDLLFRDARTANSFSDEPVTDEQIQAIYDLVKHGFDAQALDKEFFPDGDHSALAVVKIGKPGENAWFHRNPRLDYDEVVQTV
jgi:nitroreductase